MLDFTHFVLCNVWRAFGDNHNVCSVSTFKPFAQMPVGQEMIFINQSVLVGKEYIQSCFDISVLIGIVQ